MTFLYKLLNNIVNCPELVESLNFQIILSNSTNKSLFYLPNISKKKKKISLSPFYVLIYTANTINNFDFVHS